MLGEVRRRELVRLREVRLWVRDILGFVPVSCADLQGGRTWQVSPRAAWLARKAEGDEW